MNDLERLIAVEEIGKMRARYLRLLDTRNWDDLIKLYAPDATLSFQTEAPGIVNRGHAEIRKAITMHLVDVVTAHSAHMLELEFLSDTRAKGSWTLEDWLWFGPKSAAPGRHVHAFGHLNDEYVKSGSAWLIQSADITRVRVEHQG
jgi:hypothetical protein